MQKRLWYEPQMSEAQYWEKEGADKKKFHNNNKQMQI